jgi:hypothetical protein
MYITSWITWTQGVGRLVYMYLFSSEISFIEREISSIEIIRLLSTNIFISNMKLQELNH